MPSFCFRVGDGAFNADQCIELSDLAEAKCTAVKMAGQTICDEADHFWDQEEWKMTVTDRRGLTLFQILVVGIEAPVLQR